MIWNKERLEMERIQEAVREKFNPEWRKVKRETWRPLPGETMRQAIKRRARESEREPEREGFEP